MNYRPVRYNKVKKVLFDGIKFDSKLELRMYQDLKLLEKAGEITDLKLQPKFELIPKFKSASGKKVRATTYTADFMFFDVKQARTRVLDAKGFKTGVYKLKKKLFDCKHEFYLEEEI